MQLVLGIIDVHAATCRGRFHGRSFWSATSALDTLEPAVDGQGMCHGDRCGTVTGTSAAVELKNSEVVRYEELFGVKKVQESLRFYSCAFEIDRIALKWFL